jgi:diguanylate cyclase (GGDEF)-like protein
MNSGATLCGVLLVVYCLDAFNTRLLTAMIVLLGPLPLLLSLPRFMSKVAKGDAIGLYLLLAFAFYITTVVVTTTTIRGKLPANVWTLHSLTFGEMCHILAFTLVLIVRATELRKAGEKARTEHEVIRSMAYADALTGLPNRRSLTDAMSLAMVSTSPHHMLAVYLIDLDEFKEVNDTRGHEVGDQLLIEVANRLRAGTRNGDVVARLGGDEFVMVASGLRDPAQARQLGEHLLSLFETPVRVAGEEMRIGLTIGYVIARESDLEIATLLRMADSALYQGKQGGKGRLQQA